MDTKVKEYMYLLCFTTGTCHRLEMPKTIFGKDIEKFIEDQGFNINQVQFMITSHKSLMKRKVELVK